MDISSKIDTSAVYRTVADLLPAEGRDFRINIATSGDGKQELVVEGTTPMGKAWVPFLQEKLREQLSPAGVGVIGTQSGDAPTVNTVRKAVTDEFDAKLRARIKDQEDVAQRNAETIETLRKERKDNPAGDEERKAVRAKLEAEAAVRHLKLVETKVGQIRKTVHDRAKAVAEHDRKSGNDWSVNPDAPLETLFDRTNAENRMRAAEDAILSMGEHAAVLDELGGRAVNNAKYYALSK